MYIIKRDLNEEPDNHTHRFRILREHYPDLYRVVDKFFFLLQGHISNYS
jgi:hypothetical protein